MSKMKKFKARVRALAEMEGLTYAQARLLLEENREAFAPAPRCTRCEAAMDVTETEPSVTSGILRYAPGFNGRSGDEAPRRFGKCPSCGLVVDNVDLLLEEQAHDRELDSRVDAAVKAGRLARAKDNCEAMSLLAGAFHVLDRDVPGLRPWDVGLLRDWYRDVPANSTTRDAVAFLLSVWNPDLRHEVPFDAMSAMARWDRHNRRAFVGWARQPWWA